MKLSFFTLFACAAAGTSLLAEEGKVTGFRASSGVHRNTEDCNYVGNPSSGAITRNTGERYFEDIYTARGLPFRWDSQISAFYTGNSLDYIWQDGILEPRTCADYWSFDVVMFLDGSASFTNEAAATLTFFYSGEKTGSVEGRDEVTGRRIYELENENVILLAGNSEFTNAGTARSKSISVNTYESAPDFNVYLRDNAVFKNTGKIDGDLINRYESPGFYLFGNSKFINAEGGKIGNTCVNLFENAVFENRGEISGWMELELYENARIVNFGTFNPGSKGVYFEFRKDNLTGTKRLENYGVMKVGVDTFKFEIEINEKGELPSNVSANLENYGTILMDDTGRSGLDFDICLDDEDYGGKYVDNFEKFIEGTVKLIEKSNLHVKNYGIIDLSQSVSGTAMLGRMSVSSAVKLSLAEGSRINGNVTIGMHNHFNLGDKIVGEGGHVFSLDKGVLNIVLTGKGGDEALISGDLEVCNLVELDVSFAEDAVRKNKYTFTIWDGELILDESRVVWNESGNSAYVNNKFVPGSETLTGKISHFGTIYNWNLNMLTGVFIAEDVNVGEAFTVSSESQNINLGRRDSMNLNKSLDKYSGAVSGKGTVYSESDIEFSGDMSAFTGSLSIFDGEFKVAEEAKLGSGEIVTEGSLKLEGKRLLTNKTSGNGQITLPENSDVSFARSVGVKTLAVEAGATLRGDVLLTHGEDAELLLAGTLVLNIDKGEMISLGGGEVALEDGATLNLVENNATTRNMYATDSQVEVLERGDVVVIFDDGNVKGDIVSFLKTDDDLTAYATDYAVVYDTREGLRVRLVKQFLPPVDNTVLKGFSSSFVNWALKDMREMRNKPDTGFIRVSDWKQGLDENDPFFASVLSGNWKKARAILDRLSPKSYAAMVAMSAEAFYSDTRSLATRLEQRRYDGFSENAQWEFFAQAQGSSVDNDTAADAPVFDFDTHGVLAGADYKFDAETLFGLALGMSTGEAKIHNGGGKIESSDFRLTAYAGKTIEERFYVNAGTQFGYALYDVKRTTDYGKASGDTTGWSAGLFADAGTLVTLSAKNKLYAMPYVGIAYVHAQADAFTESGSDKAFDADDVSGDSLRARVGCGFSWGFELVEKSWRLGLDAAYSYDFLGDEVDVDVTAQDGSRISETAKALPESVFSVGPTLNVDLNSAASLYAGYTFDIGTDSYVKHSANLGFRMRF